MVEQTVHCFDWAFPREVRSWRSGSEHLDEPRDERWLAWPHKASVFRSACSARSLIEQNLPHLWIIGVDAKCGFHPDRQAALHSRAKQQCFEPASDIRKAAEVVAVALGPARPADARHVSDRVGPGKEFTVPESRVHHAVDPAHLIAEALDGVGKFLRCISAEMVCLPGLGTEIGHLPEQPLIDFDAPALVMGIEPPGLAAEILENGTRLEDRDRLAVRPTVVDDRRHAIVGRDRQELRLELLTLGYVHRDHCVREAALLEHDRDLPAVGRRPEIEADGCMAACGPRFLIKPRLGSGTGAAVLADRLFDDTGHRKLPERRDDGALRRVWN